MPLKRKQREGRRQCHYKENRGRRRCDCTYHSADSSRFLDPEGLHHLKHIHHSLSLAALNGGGYGTEHARAAHCVTVEGIGRERQWHTTILWYSDSSTQ